MMNTFTRLAEASGGELPYYRQAERMKKSSPCKARMIQETVDDIFTWQRRTAAALQQSKPILSLKNKRK